MHVCVLCVEECGGVGVCAGARVHVGVGVDQGGKLEVDREARREERRKEGEGKKERRKPAILQTFTERPLGYFTKPATLRTVSVWRMHGSLRPSRTRGIIPHI